MRDDTKCEHGEFTDGCAPCMAECVARLFTAEAERDEARAVNHRSFMRMVEVERLRAVVEGLTCYELFRRLPEDFQRRAHAALAEVKP
jgi:hypothetical protein